MKDKNIKLLGEYILDDDSTELHDSDQSEQSSNLEIKNKNSEATENILELDLDATKELDNSSESKNENEEVKENDEDQPEVIVNLKDKQTTEICDEDIKDSSDKEDADDEEEADDKEDADDEEDEIFLSTIKTDECALITSLFARRLVLPLVKISVRLGLSANLVTIFGGLSWFASLFTIVVAAHLFAIKSYIFSILVLFFTAFLWVWGYVLDVVDGSLSRYYKTSSLRGFYLDYVFHLLFKPGFVVSIGAALSLLNKSSLWIYFAILALAANWTCAESASEHVLCEEIGKGRLEPHLLSKKIRKSVFLGTTDIKSSAKNKKKGFFKTLYTLLKEILNYYGQSVFFAFLAIIDCVMMIVHYMSSSHDPYVWNWRILTWGYLVLFSLLILRIPFRIYREYKRIALLDKAN